MSLLNAKYQKIEELIISSDYKHSHFLQICYDLGINPEEVKPLELNNFQQKGVPKKIAMLRHTHYEAKRQFKIKQIIEEMFKRMLTSLTPRTQAKDPEPDEIPQIIEQKHQEISRKVTNEIDFHERWANVKILQEKDKLNWVKKYTKRVKAAAEKRQQAQSELRERIKEKQEKQDSLLRERFHKEATRQRKEAIKSFKSEMATTSYTNRSIKKSYPKRFSSTQNTRVPSMDTAHDFMIQTKLADYEAKLNKSNQLYSRICEEKVSPCALQSFRVTQTKAFAEELENQQETERLYKLVNKKLAHDKAKVRFIQTIKTEQLLSSTQRIKENKDKLREIQMDNLKNQQRDSIQKNKNFDIRSDKRDKSIQQANRQRKFQSRYRNEQLNLRKKDQEEKLQRLERLRLNKREKLIQKLQQKQQKYDQIKEERDIITRFHEIKEQVRLDSRIQTIQKLEKIETSTAKRNLKMNISVQNQLN